MMRVTSVLFGGSLFWAFGPTLGDMALRWSIDPRYSHGYLVPIFALVLLWLRRGLPLSWEVPPGVCWLGVAVLGLGMALHLAGARFYVNWFEAVALLPVLAGMALLLGGWPGLRWTWPSIGFLLFMIPLPFRLEVALGAPLQGAAARCSAFLLQMLGQQAVTEGNIIALRTSRLGVVEACNGLGMLVTFTALATALAILIDRPWLDRAVIVVSAVPIAFLANVSRITATGLLQETLGHDVAGVVYHDLAGWLMMPLALALLWGELKLLSRLLVDMPSPCSPARLVRSRITG
jgi:exosortase